MAVHSRLQQPARSGLFRNTVGISDSVHHGGTRLHITHPAAGPISPPNMSQELKAMAIPIPGNVRELLDAPNYVHLTTLRTDGSPRNWVVWVGLEDDHILVCTSDAIWKAKDMRRDPRVALSVTDTANPYRMAAIQGRVVDVRPDQDSRYMDPISIKYTSAPFPSRGPDRVCFVIAVEKAAQRTLNFIHDPG
jgi:PPOX class probable F420-dependent enzyme